MITTPQSILTSYWFNYRPSDLPLPYFLISQANSGPFGKFPDSLSPSLLNCNPSLLNCNHSLLNCNFSLCFYFLGDTFLFIFSEYSVNWIDFFFWGLHTDLNELLKNLDISTYSMFLLSNSNIDTYVVCYRLEIVFGGFIDLLFKLFLEFFRENFYTRFYYESLWVALWGLMALAESDSFCLWDSVDLRL